MTPALRTLFVNQLKEAIEVLGPNFESFGQKMIECIYPFPLKHGGQNALGQPVGHAVDTVADDGTLAAEYSADATSFKPPFRKMLRDVKHARKKHPDATTSQGLIPA